MFVLSVKISAFLVAYLVTSLLLFYVLYSQIADSAVGATPPMVLPEFAVSAIFLLTFLWPTVSFST